jgi:hypothetical protein
MPTGDERVNLILKRFLSQNRMSENFMEYLDTVLTDGLSRIFPASGLFTYPVSFGFSGAGKLTLSPDPLEGIDNQGHVIVLEGSGDLVDISFEDDGSSVYWVGLKYMQIPSGVYANPRTGIPEYDKLIDEVGELGFPDTVVAGAGSTIVFNVNTLLEPSVDHTGRVIRVYLVNPLSSDANVAFEDLYVAYSSLNNTVTSADSFGQGALSLNPLFYKVALLGPSIEKSVLNPFGDEYIILGEVTSTGGTPTVDDGEQLNLGGGGGHTLQRAYDGFGGSGSGRDIVANDEAVHISQVNNSIYDADIMHAALRITKDTDKAATGATIAEYERGLDIKTRYLSKGAVVHRTNILDVSVNGFLNAEEAIDVTTASDDIDFTRVGVDLTFTGLVGDIWAGIDLAEISGSTLGNDGVYIIDTVSATALQLDNLDGTSASLVQELSNPALKVSIYRPTLVIGADYDGLTIHSLHDFQKDGSDIGQMIHLYLPASAPDDGVNFFISKNLSADTFQITNDLDLDSDGRLVSNHAGSAIEATAGDVVADQNITATNGNVTANDDVVATTGKVESTAGNVISLVGDVKAGSDFEYVAARTFTTSINLEHGFDISNAWVYYAGGSGSGIATWRHIVGDNDNEIRFPFLLPNGTILKKVEILIDKQDTSTTTMEVWQSDVDWTTPANGSTPSSLGTDSSIVSGPQILDTGTLSHIITSSIDRYYVDVATNADLADEIHGIRVTFEITTLRPMGS